MRGFNPGRSPDKKPQASGARGFANGGPVRGPGTGTSDDVPDSVPPGTFIAPADTVEAVGEGNLAAMGGGARGFSPAPKGEVPVQLSNGEYKLPPEQVHAIGAEVLNGIKDATHTPVPEFRGFNPQQAPYEEPRQFFANGGLVEEEERRRPNSFGDAATAANGPGVTQPPAAAPAALPAAPAPGTPGNTWPGSQPARNPSASPETPVGQAIGEGARSIANSILPDTRAVLGQAGQDIAQNMREGQYGAAVGNTVRGALAAVPAVANDTIGQLPAAARGFSAGAGNALRSVAQPIVAGTLLEPLAGAAPPPASASSTAAPAAAGLTAAAPVAPPPAPGARGFSTEGAGQWAASPQAQPSQIEPGIYRSGNSYSDTADGAARGFNPNGGQVSAQNMAAADALEARGMAQRAGERAAFEARGFRPGGGIGVIPDGDAGRREARNASVGSNLGSPNAGALAAVRGLRESREDRADAREMMRLGFQADMARSQDASAFQRDQFREAGADRRAQMQDARADARDAASAAIQSGDLALRREAQGFQTRAAQRQEALYQRYDAAKTPEERSAIAQQIRDLSGKSEPANRFTVVPGGQEWDATANTMRNVPARVLNNQTGQFVDGAGARGVPPMDQNPQAIAIKNNTNMSREQKVEALRKLGYQ